MIKATKVCSNPRCGNLQPCPEHGRRGDTQARGPAWQDSTRRKRLPPGWEKLRLFVLDRDPICKLCNAAPSTECDHVEPGDNHDLANLQGVCTPCHRHKTAEEAQRGRTARAAGQA